MTFYYELFKHKKSLLALLLLLTLTASGIQCSLAGEININKTPRPKMSEWKFSHGKLLEGHFEKTGQMVIPRIAPTAVLLKDGRVLVFNGQVETDASDFKLGIHKVMPAEIYDPKTGKFSLTGRLQVRRSRYASTLLPDGRVLVIGGEHDLGECPEIEAYDPKTGEFSIIGKLAIPRHAPGVIVLPDGTVLIAGGQKGGGNLDTAEIFDPKTNQSTLLENKMAIKRYKPNLILLDNGTIFIADGTNGKGHSDEEFQPFAEIYDYKIRKFIQKIPLLNKKHRSITIKLSNGNVLLIGGMGPHFREISSIEIFDPVNNIFIPAGRLPMDIGTLNGVLLPNGKVFMGGGGVTVPGAGLSDIRKYERLFIYNPETQEADELGYMDNHPRSPGVVLLKNGKVLIVGKAYNGQSAILYVSQ